MVVWSAILTLCGVGFGLNKPNLIFKFSMRILTPNLPSNNTSSMILFPIYNWITAMRWYIVIKVVFIFGTNGTTNISWTFLRHPNGLSSFSLCHKFFLRLGVF